MSILKCAIFLTVCAVLAWPFSAPALSPFKWSWSDGNGELRVQVAIPPQHYLYHKTTSVTVADASGKPLTPERAPGIATHDDPFSGKVEVYAPGVNVWTYKLKNVILPVSGKIRYLGCKDKTATAPAMCFAPGSETFTVGAGASTTKSAAATQAENISVNLDKALAKFAPPRTSGGLLSTNELLEFLKGDNRDMFADKSIFMIIALIIVGGLLLNLTPCVLPMIPVNLAIIGAGGQADSKRRGFARGGAYGLGIALAYGALGLAAALGGTTFGALNSSAWFNFAVAAVFAVLALAMFDLFMIDFSKYGAKLGPKDSQRGKLITALIMGAVAALLAGACVAPVVIAVLLYSARLYASGNMLGLFLPFLLGAAMGLPWPFAGAGMAVIPKPGKWMTRVKQFFGVVILLAALYYGYLGYSLLPAASKGAAADSQPDKLAIALNTALKENKPVFIDFWATWCKNCAYMEKVTFKDQVVRDALRDFVVVKFQAEDMTAPDIKPLLEYFKVQGLPAFAVLIPKKKN